MQWQALEPDINEAIARLQLPRHFIDIVNQFYFPLAQHIAELHTQSAKALLIGINGAQGTGKSTLAELLKVMLHAGSDLSCVVLSIDDIYLTRGERQLLAEDVHPLLLTRGVPGTHDIELGSDTIDRLMAAQPEETIPIPRFNKADDDREPQALWDIHHGKADIVLFEGWCVGALPEAPASLLKPINDLEKTHDSDGRWRRYVNSTLAETYQPLFGLIDYLVMLKAPSMQSIFEWRWLQEQKLASENKGSGSRIMNQKQVQRFIQHYERLTRHILQEMPNRADQLFTLTVDHQIAPAQRPNTS